MIRIFLLTLVATMASSVTLAAQEKKGPPKEFTNSLGMKFVWIPPGSFMMGSPKEEKERFAHETQHKVTLTKGFYMGVYTVTQEQWREVMGNSPRFFKGEKNLPVEQVSWDDCQEFIKKLREKGKDKKLYRLPTEAEWEFCCRGGTTTPFWCGKTISTEQANYNGSFVYDSGKEGVSRGKTTPVGTFPANPWGLHDMHGNVWQWCQDRYGDYPENEVVDPKGPEKGEHRVLRGGSYGNAPDNCRSACRTTGGTGVRSAGSGLRVCFFEHGEEKKAEPTKSSTKILPPKDFTNSIGMKFVWIPPGSFMMGSPKEEKPRSDNESQHKVTLTKGYYIAIFTVTQEQWQEVMGNNPSHFKGEKNLPVDSVSWEDCQEFVKKLREKDKKPYRLPTEAEFEYACRAGAITRFYFGDTISRCLIEEERLCRSPTFAGDCQSTIICNCALRFLSPVKGHTIMASMDGITGRGFLASGNRYRRIVSPVRWSHTFMAGAGFSPSRFHCR